MTTLRALVVLCALLCSTFVEAAVTHTKSGQGQCTAGVFSDAVLGGCSGATVSRTFSYTANATGGGILIYLGCGASATPSAVTLTASGWTTTQVGTITGNSTGGFGAVFKAYAPNTSAATFTMAWTVATCNAFMDVLIDEFSGMDASDFVDNNGSGQNTTGGCAINITPVANNTAVWIACMDNVTAVGGAYTKGADDTVNDWTEWKILSGGAGASQSSSFTTSGAFVNFAVTVKETGGGGGPAGCKNGLLLMGAGCDDAVDLQTADRVWDTGLSK